MLLIIDVITYHDIIPGIFPRELFYKLSYFASEAATGGVL